MSDDLVKRLRATTDGATVNPDGPEAAARIAALEAAVTQCRTLSAMLKPQADRIAELEAALRDARARYVELDDKEAAEAMAEIINKALGDVK